MMRPAGKINAGEDNSAVKLIHNRALLENEVAAKDTAEAVVENRFLVNGLIEDVIKDKIKEEVIKPLFFKKLDIFCPSIPAEKLQELRSLLERLS